MKYSSETIIAVSGQTVFFNDYLAKEMIVESLVVKVATVFFLLRTLA